MSRLVSVCVDRSRIQSPPTSRPLTQNNKHTHPSPTNNKMPFFHRSTNTSRSGAHREPSSSPESRSPPWRANPSQSHDGHNRGLQRSEDVRQINILRETFRTMNCLNNPNLLDDDDITAIPRLYISSQQEQTSNSNSNTPNTHTSHTSPTNHRVKPKMKCITPEERQIFKTQHGIVQDTQVVKVRRGDVVVTYDRNTFEQMHPRLRFVEPSGIMSDEPPLHLTPAPMYGWDQPPPGYAIGEERYGSLGTGLLEQGEEDTQEGNKNRNHEAEFGIEAGQSRVEAGEEEDCASPQPPLIPTR
ncbi:hypothetical protein DFH27DRAFT_600237 [Peziza echinospora]|nr:hypothetical protein DFH27DRAFT_600237 [Peziza echinospora]